MRATSLSWSPSGLAAGNAVASVGAAASAALSWLPASSERDITREYSLSNTSARVAVTSVFSAAEQALDPNSVPCAPVSATGPLAVTWYCTAVLPDRNTALPDTLTQVKVALPLPAA